MEYLDFGGQDYIITLLVAGDVKPTGFVGRAEHISSHAAEKWLESLGLVWKKPPNDYDGKQYLISKNQNRLDNLYDALNPYNDYQVGVCLGFPIDAIEAYYENQVRVDTTPSSTIYHDSVDPSVKMFEVQMFLDGNHSPDWCAYLTHSPACSRLLDEGVSPSSIELAIQYMNFIRDHHPKIAEVHESNHRQLISAFSGHPRWLKKLESYSLSNKNESRS